MAKTLRLPDREQIIKQMWRLANAGAGDAVRLACFPPEEITQARMDRWNQYKEMLSPLAQAGRIELPYIPEECAHNAHMFYIKTKDMEERSRLIAYLKEREILSVFHYIPLHSAPAGMKYGRFHGEDRYTTKESERLLRLPLFYKLTADETQYIAEQVKAFYAAN